MKKLVLLAAVAALFVSMLAIPASANAPLAGVIANGTAVVGKISGGCDNHGGANPTGAGIGLPGLPLAKSAFYRFSGPFSSTSGDGVLSICGDLSPTAAGVGASCGISQSTPSEDSGKGKATINDGGPKNGYTLWINNFGWKSSAGTFFLATGKANDNGSKSKDQEYGIVALVNARGTGCETKTPTKTDGSAEGGRNFTINAVFVVA